MKIPKYQYDKLVEIKNNLNFINKQIDELFDIVIDITKEEDYTTDYILNDFGSVKDLLKVLNIEIED